MKGFYVIVLTAAIMGWLAAQARTARVRKIGNGWLFPPVRALQAVFSAVLAMGVAFVFFGYRGPEADRTLLVLGGIGFVAFGAITWPKGVYLSDSRLRQRCWWGGWKTLTWSEVSDANEQRDGSIILRGGRTKIVFTQYHADRDLFLEVTRKNGLRLQRL
jgi:hypothetical protein